MALLRDERAHIDKHVELESTLRCQGYRFNIRHHFKASFSLQLHFLEMRKSDFAGSLQPLLLAGHGPCSNGAGGRQMVCEMVR